MGRTTCKQKLSGQPSPQKETDRASTSADEVSKETQPKEMATKAKRTKQSAKAQKAAKKNDPHEDLSGENKEGKEKAAFNCEMTMW